MNYAGQLNSNEIFGAIFNMIISQEVFADNIKDTKSSLVDTARVDGSLYGDTKLYYSTDVLKSTKWGNDAEATNLLQLHRPDSPASQAITLDVFRQISLTVDDYMSKRAFSTEGAFSSFNSVMQNWIADTKRVYDSTTYNAFIGTVTTTKGKQSVVLSLPTDTNKETENRLQAQTIAQKLADIIVDLEDVTRDYNDYGYLRSYSADDFMYVWNSAWVNKITKLDLPTIFHKDFIDKFAEYTLPSRYFGKVLDKTTTTADGLTIRALEECDVKLVEAYTDKTGKAYKAGDSFHCFAGDIIPSKVVIANNTSIIVPAYKEDGNVIFKIVHKRSVPYMSAFEVATSFFNAKSLTENRYLTFGRNTLEYLYNYPLVTVEASAE